MNELFTHEDFIAAKEFARIECSEELGKTLRENIEKTLFLLSKMTLTSDDLLIDHSADPHFFIDYMEDEIGKKRSQLTPEQGLNVSDQEKLNMKPGYFRLS